MAAPAPSPRAGGPTGMPRAFRVEDIPGYAAALEAAKDQEFATRSDAWVDFTFDLGGGVRLRTMTVEDYELLLRQRSPVLWRALPEPEDLALFCWVLSPEFERWNHGWRTWFPSLRRFVQASHSKKVHRLMDLRGFLKLQDFWEGAHPEAAFEIPDDSPFAKLLAAVFEYRDRMFFDQPPALAKGGEGTGLCYLTDWFCKLQREFHLPTAEIQKMPLPQLFARLKEIQLWHNPKTPTFNKRQQELHAQVQRALASGMSVMDLLGGKFKFN